MPWEIKKSPDSWLRSAIHWLSRGKGKDSLPSFTFWQEQGQSPAQPALLRQGGCVWKVTALRAGRAAPCLSSCITCRFLSQDTPDFFWEKCKEYCPAVYCLASKDPASVLQLSVAGVRCGGGTQTSQNPTTALQEALKWRGTGTDPSCSSQRAPLETCSLQGWNDFKVWLCYLYD